MTTERPRWIEYETCSYTGIDEDGEPKYVARKFYRCSVCWVALRYRPHTAPIAGQSWTVTKIDKGGVLNMIQSFWIPDILPGMNEFLTSSRCSPYKVNNLKKAAQKRVTAAFLAAGIQPVDPPVRILMEFHERDRRRDPDNVIGGANKVILDALCEGNMIADDSQKILSGEQPLAYSFVLDRRVPGIMVTIIGMEKKEDDKLE